MTTTNVTYWGTVLGSNEGVYVLHVLGLCRRNPYNSARDLEPTMYGDLSYLRWTYGCSVLNYSTAVVVNYGCSVKLMHGTHGAWCMYELNVSESEKLRPLCGGKMMGRS